MNKYVYTQIYSIYVPTSIIYYWFISTNHIHPSTTSRPECWSRRCRGERRGIAPPIKGLKSLSPLDLSLVLLSSPTEIFKLCPRDHLISHHSASTGFHGFPQGKFSRSASRSLSASVSLPPGQRGPAAPHLKQPAPAEAPTLWGQGSRCQSPQRKVGASTKVGMWSSRST